MIENYKFGSIIINGKEYNHDVGIRNSDEVLSWWRKESHVVDLEDIERVLKQKPDIIIIGTGASGIAKVTERAKKAIAEQGIELIIQKTKDAVKIFNNFQEKQKKVIGLFHLTC